jgi:GTP-binding protein
MFTDVVKVNIAAGKGGDGVVSFHRTRGNAKGGPDGGDGGNGGNVIVVADHNTNTLSKYRTSRLWEAEDGTPGSSGKKRGRKGEDIELVVPPGTVVMEGDSVLADLEKQGDEAIIAHGGRAGFGNAHFISSVRQAPKMAELGEPGEEKEVTFELKIVADVGLVGLPNAGKSTLLSVVSNAKPKIANYPFTTLEPNLGVVDIDESTFMMADIPGLIEGASKGKGLGDEFLRHVERTKVLLHIIDATSENIAQDYTTIQKELKEYKIDLSGRPQIIVLSKIESVPKANIKGKIKEVADAAGVKQKEVHTISAVANMGLAELMRATLKLVEKAKSEVKPEEVEEMPVIRLDDSAMWDIKKTGNTYEVTGKDIEGFAKRTNMDQYQSVQRLHHILDRKGIMRQLIRMGARPGESKVIIAGREIKF